MTMKFAKYKGNTFFSGQAYTRSLGANTIYTDADNQTLNKDLTYRADEYRGMWEFEKNKIVFTGTTTPPEVSLTTLIRTVYFGDFNYKKSGEFNGGTLVECQAVTHPEALQPYPGVSFQLTEPLRISSLSSLDSLLNTQVNYRRVGNLGHVESDWHLSPYSTSKEEEGLYISAPSKFDKKSADKITNFNPSTDTLEIDTDSFGIDSSATFASGKNKKEVKKKLAKQDFDFLYDEKKGGLYFNENGSDIGFGDGGIIAILKGTPELTADDLAFI